MLASAILSAYVGLNCLERDFYVQGLVFRHVYGFPFVVWRSMLLYGREGDLREGMGWDLVGIAANVAVAIILVAGILLVRRKETAQGLED